jgi:hypothetical protein
MDKTVRIAHPERQTKGYFSGGDEIKQRMSLSFEVLLKALSE